LRQITGLCAEFADQSWPGRPAKDSRYSSAYARFIQTIIALRTFSVPLGEIADLFAKEQIVLRLLKVDALGASPTWFLDQCDNKGSVNTQLPEDFPFRRIVSYQVPLKSKLDKSNWGKVDMLGIDKGGKPVVIELKVTPKESILRAVVEALAYAVALQKNWEKGLEEGLFQMDWKIVPGAVIGGQLEPLPLVVMAPKKYWEMCFDVGSERKECMLSDAARVALRKLFDVLREKGYPVYMVEFAYEKIQLEGQTLPPIKDVGIFKWVINKGGNV